MTTSITRGTATPAFNNGTPTREGYEFAGWSPAVAATVTSTVTYTATWKRLIDSASVTPGESLTYTGFEQTQIFTVTLDGKTLAKGTDYTVTGSKGTDADDSYKLTVKGIGSYSGTKEVPWKLAKAASSATVAAIPDLVFNDAYRDLVTESAVVGGTVVYSFTEAGPYSAGIPQKRDANENGYTVYFYVKGDSNHNDSAKSSVTVAIKRKDISKGLTVDVDEYPVYTGREKR